MHSVSIENLGMKTTGKRQQDIILLFTSFSNCVGLSGFQQPTSYIGKGVGIRNCFAVL